VTAEESGFNTVCFIASVAQPLSEPMDLASGLSTATWR
jgi:hypothetical protein